jgi:hypothetical protein
MTGNKHWTRYDTLKAIINRDKQNEPKCFALIPRGLNKESLRACIFCGIPRGFNNPEGRLTMTACLYALS